MAVAATLKTPPGVHKVGTEFKAKYTLVFSGSYSTGGDTLDLRNKGIPGNAVPEVTIVGQGGFFYQYVKGANLGVGKVKILVATTTGANLPLAEHSAAAVDAAVVADVITATVEVPAFKAA